VSFRCGGGEDELAAATRLAETLGNRVRLVDGRIELLTAEVTAALHALTSWAVEQRVDIDSWSVAQPSLEQVFLDLVGGAEGE
jgi:ABC-2 type transport system ATP-binding protein